MYHSDDLKSPRGCSLGNCVISDNNRSSRLESLAARRLSVIEFTAKWENELKISGHFYNDYFRNRIVINL